MRSLHGLVASGSYAQPSPKRKGSTPDASARKFPTSRIFRFSLVESVRNQRRLRRDIIPDAGMAEGCHADFCEARALVLPQVAGDQELCDRKLLAVSTDLSELLEQHWGLVKAFAEALLAHTTLTEKQISAIFVRKP